MSCQEDVLKISKKLEKMISSDTQDNVIAMDLLNALKKIPMTLDVLQKTHIGMTVNNFRKSSKEEDVISLSKSLIKSWKKLLSTDSTSQSNSNSGNSNSSKSTMEENSPPEKEEKSESDKEDDDKVQSEKPKKYTPVGVSMKTTPAQSTGDSVRNKCREMLYQALTVGDVPEEVDAVNIAGLVEECIYGEFDNTEMKYKNRIRSRYSNLKDAKNPNLRYKVLVGEVPPERIAVMTPEEMASDNLKLVRDKMQKENIKDAQLAVSGGTITDLLKCGKCKGRRCTYNQMQTRSSDEPMTTFAFCNDCGHRWKFC